MSGLANLQILINALLIGMKVKKFHTQMHLGMSVAMPSFNILPFLI